MEDRMWLLIRGKQMLLLRCWLYRRLQRVSALLAPPQIEVDHRHRRRQIGFFNGNH